MINSNYLKDCATIGSKIIENYRGIWYIAKTLNKVSIIFWYILLSIIYIQIQED